MNQNEGVFMSRVYKNVIVAENDIQNEIIINGRIVDLNQMLSKGIFIENKTPFEQI